MYSQPSNLTYLPYSFLFSLPLPHFILLPYLTNSNLVHKPPPGGSNATILTHYQVLRVLRHLSLWNWPSFSVHSLLFTSTATILSGPIYFSPSFPHFLSFFASFLNSFFLSNNSNFFLPFSLSSLLVFVVCSCPWGASFTVRKGVCLEGEGLGRRQWAGVVFM